MPQAVGTASAEGPANAQKTAGRPRYGSGLGKERWPIERLMAWFNDDRQLRIRDERLPAIHQAFLNLAAALICFNAL